MEKIADNEETQQLRVSEVPDDEIEIDLREIFFALLANWKSILMAFLIGAVLLGAYHSFLLDRSYQADAKIYITNTDSLITFSDLQLSAALTEDYANIINSRTVLNQVIDDLQLDLTYEELQELVEVENPDSTHIIHLMVTCNDLELSRNIANALLNVGIDQIYQIIGSGEPTVIDYAEADAVKDVTPSLLVYMLIGGVVAAFVICALLVVRLLTNTTMRSEEDVDRYLHLPVLAAIPYYKEK